jgi:CBS domain-containing protein
MLKVKDIMTTELITVSPETEILQAAGVLLGNHINGVPVVDEAGKLVGILCQSDLIAQQKRLPIPSFFTFMDGLFEISSAKHIEKEIQKIAAITVAQAMTPDPVFVEPDMSIQVVAGLMVDNGYHTIPVLQEGRLVGIVGKDDILNTLIAVPGKEGEQAETLHTAVQKRGVQETGEMMKKEERINIRSVIK